MRRYKMVPWILLILSIINATLAAPVASREIRHTYIDVIDVREDVIPVSRSEKQDDGLERLWGKPPPAMHPRSGSAESVLQGSDYESALSSPNSFRTATGGFQPVSPGEVSDIESENHRVNGGAPSEDYLASDEGGPGSSKSVSFAPSPDSDLAGSSNRLSFAPPDSSLAGSQKSSLSRLVSKSKSFFSNLASKSKNFFGKLVRKLKFWRRISESVSA
jgi:hypothetical protein